MVGKRLFVGNLANEVSDSELEQLFSPFGTVQSVQIMEGHGTGRDKGFGFVEMESEAGAQAAILGLKDQEINGRRLTVDEAKPRKFRGGGGFGGGGGGGFGGGGGGGGRGGFGGGGGGRRY